MSKNQNKVQAKMTQMKISQLINEYEEKLAELKEMQNIKSPQEIAIKMETITSSNIESAKNFIHPGKQKQKSTEFKFIRKKDHAEKIPIPDRFDTISQKSIEILSSKGLDFHHKRKQSDFVMSPDQNIFYSPKPL